MVTGGDEDAGIRELPFFSVARSHLGHQSDLGPPLDQCAITRICPNGAGANFPAFVNCRAALRATMYAAYRLAAYSWHPAGQFRAPARHRQGGATRACARTLSH
jgi:hypothetical protein